MTESQSSQEPSNGNVSPLPYEVGAFNNLGTFDHLWKEEKIIHSLDVLASNIQPFTDPNNHWVTSLALFHYTDKGKRYNWDDDHALILTLADLFCDEVPSSARSVNPQQNLMISAQNYIRSMKKLWKDWSKVTVEDYMEAMEKYPRWPTINDPSVDSDGNIVEIADLMQAWSYCFKHPSRKSIYRVRSGIWAIIVGFANYDIVANETTSNIVNDFAITIGCRVDASETLIKLTVDHLLLQISNNLIFKTIKNFLASESSSLILKECDVKGLKFRNAFRTTIQAMIQFSDFPWGKLGVVFSDQESKLLFDMYLVRRKKIIGFNDHLSFPYSGEYPAFVCCARQLIIRAEGKNYSFDDPDLNSLDQVKVGQMKMMIEDYFEKTMGDESPPMSESMIFSLIALSM